MKINTFPFVIIFSILISFSIQINENQKYKKFLSNIVDNGTPEQNQIINQEDPVKRDEPVYDEDYDYDDEDGNFGYGYKGIFAESQNETEPESNTTDTPETDKIDNGKRTYINIKCLYVSKYNVYTLQKLTKENGYTHDVKSGKLNFNFCKDLSGLNSTMILEKNTANQNDNDNKVKFAGSIEGNENSKNEWTELNEKDGTKGVQIRLSEGDVCEFDKSQKHQTFFYIYCDDTIEDKDFEKYLNFSEFHEDRCKHYISAKSIYGCALNDWYLLRRLIKEYNYVFSTVLILVGLFLAAFGKKFQTPTVIIVTGTLVCYFVTVMILSFAPSLIKTEQNLCILMAVGFVVGGALGAFTLKKIIIFTVLIGGCCGYSVAEFVYQFIAGFITANPTVLYWVVTGICILLGLILGYWAINAIIIIGTSVIGGYIVMRGVTFIFDNYMELAEFADLVKSGEYEQLKDIKNGWVYAYLGLWLVITIGGIYYQCYGYKKSKKEESEKGDKKDKKFLS